MICLPKLDSDGIIRCSRKDCRREFPQGSTIETVAKCRTIEVDSGLPLGDYTERLLASLGITPDRYVAVKQALGLAPTCGCKARKEWLNRLGRWITDNLGED